MCFTNNPDQLARFRKLKNSIKLWKKGQVDEKTGLVTTSYDDGAGDNRVVWKQGTIVKPHRIRKPLKECTECTAGLYFHTSPDCDDIDYRSGYMVIARVKPQDIIAVSDDGKTVCCVAAKVIKAPNPNQRQMRIKFLKESIFEAKNNITFREQETKRIEAEREDYEEGLQRLKDELKDLATK